MFHVKQGVASASRFRYISRMLTNDILALLIAERNKLENAIIVLQGDRRRGRPPKNLANISVGTAKRRGRPRQDAAIVPVVKQSGRPPWTPEQRAKFERTVAAKKKEAAAEAAPLPVKVKRPRRLNLAQRLAISERMKALHHARKQAQA